jgi:hypothetical protein
MGRKKTFTINQIDKYFEEYKKDCETNEKPSTIQGFESYICAKRLRKKFTEYENDPKYSATIKKIKKYFESDLVNNALKGKYNASVSIFLMKNNYGYKDSQEIKHSGLKPLEITVDSEDKKKKIDEL